jgi:hypothetical protein
MRGSNPQAQAFHLSQSKKVVYYCTARPVQIVQAVQNVQIVSEPAGTVKKGNKSV